MTPCSHDSFYTDCTAVADSVGFKRPPFEKRILAASTSGQKRKDTYPIPEEVIVDENTFPGPLALPFDSLTQIPPGTSLYHQSCKVWRAYTARNSVEEGRNNIFVIAPPVFAGAVGQDGDAWDVPLAPEDSCPGLPKWTASSDQLKGVNNYLAAFYHPMVIQQSKVQLKWRPFKGSPPKLGQSYIGLEIPTVRQMFPIRCRPGKDGASKMQVHAPDILAAILHRMPPKAHATVVLVDFDMYDPSDDENNNFTITKAFGGDRIVVVSTFRLHPALDGMQEVDREHAWPASHCKAYADGLISDDEDLPLAKRLKMSSDEPDKSTCAFGSATQATPEPKTTPGPAKSTSALLSDTQAHEALPEPKASTALRSAIQAFNINPQPKTTTDLTDLWFSRVAFAASRGLGFCFGMEHCTFYACLLQGVSSARQQSHIPPYLCPICLTKLSYELGPLLGSGARINLQQRWIKEHTKKLDEFCETYYHVAQFLAFEAWLGKRIEK